MSGIICVYYEVMDGPHAYVYYLVTMFQMRPHLDSCICVWVYLQMSCLPAGGGTLAGGGSPGGTGICCGTGISCGGPGLLARSSSMVLLRMLFCCCCKSSMVFVCMLACMDAMHCTSCASVKSAMQQWTVPLLPA